MLHSATSLSKSEIDGAVHETGENEAWGAKRTTHPRKGRGKEIAAEERKDQGAYADSRRSTTMCLENLLTYA